MRTKIKISIIILLFLLVMSLLLFSYMTCSLPQNKTIEQYSDFDRNKFLILLFPVKESDSFRRAVISNLTEYDRNVIEVYNDDVAIAMAKSEFTVVPIANEYHNYVNRLNKKLVQWSSKTDWNSIEYSFILFDRGIKAMLIAKDNSGTIQKYTYLVDGNSVQPVSIVTELNIAKKMAK